MEFNKINADQICSVRSFINKICDRYTYEKLKKSLCFITRKEGYYSIWSISYNNPLTKEYIESKGNLFCKYDAVYYKPHLVFNMSDGCIHAKYFNTEIELNNFIQTNLSKIKLIDR
jgi:hypothetical protein